MGLAESFVVFLICLTNNLFVTSDLLGCYSDTAKSPDFYISADFEGVDNVEPENCISNCKQVEKLNGQEINYAGIQSASICLCALQLKSEVNDKTTCDDNFNATGQGFVQTEVYTVNGETKPEFAVKMSCEVNDRSSPDYAVVTCSVNEGNPDAKYSFNFDDGSLSTNLDFKTVQKHEYYLPGEYIISVSAVLPDGFYTIDYQRVVIQLEISSSNFDINCPSKSAIGKSVICNLTSISGSDLELTISSSDDACPVQKTFNLPEINKIPVGMMMSSDTPDMLNESLLPNTDSATFIIFRNTMIRQEGFITAVNFHLASSGKFKLSVLRPVLPPAHLYCSIDEFVVKYTVQHEFADVGNFENAKTPLFVPISIPEKDAPYVIPGDVLAYSAQSSAQDLGSIGYRKIIPGEASDFLLIDWTTTSQKLEVSHFIRAIISPNISLTFNQTFDKAGSCTLTATLQSKNKKITSKKSKIAVIGKLQALSLKCPEYLAVGAEAQFNLTISSDSEVNLEWDFDDGTNESVIESEIQTEWSKIHIYNVPGDYRVVANISNSQESVVKICATTVLAKLQKEDWDLTSNSPQPIPGNITFNLAYRSEANKFPSNLTSIFYWTDGTQSTFDLNSDNVTFTHLFRKPDTYLITVQIFNKISDINLTTSVEVFGKVQLKVIPTFYGEYANAYFPGYGPGKNIFRQNDLIKLTAVTLGEIESFKVQWPNGTTTTHPSSTTELFTKYAEIQNISIIYTAINSDLGPTTYTVDLMIFDINWMLDVFIYDYDDITDYNTSKLFTLHTTNPSACILVDYGDGKPLEKFGTKENCGHKFPNVELHETEKFPVNTSHRYTERNNYNVTVVSFTATANRTKRESVLVNYYPFRPKAKVWIRVNSTEYLFPLTLNRSRDKRFETAAEIPHNGTNNIETKMAWTIWSVDEKGNDRIEHNWIDDYDDAKNKSYLFIRPRFLPYGLYKVIYNFSVYVSSMDLRFPLQCSAYSYLKIVQSDLIAIFIPNSLSYIERSYGHEVTLNPVGLSIDPDNLDEHGFVVKWICKQSSENYVDNFEDSANVQVVPSPSETRSASESQGGCFGKGPGVLNIPGNGTWVLNTSSFYKSDIQVRISLKIELGNRHAFTKLDLRVYPHYIPKVDMTCGVESLCQPIQDGYILLNPNLRLSMIGQCDDCGDLKNYEIWWEFSTSVPDEQIIGRDQEMMALAKEFIRAQEEFKIRMLAVNATTNETLAKAEMQFKVDKPPINGTCKVTGKGEFALVDFFYVSCEDWVDPDGHGIKLYKIFAIEDKFENPLVSSSDINFALILRIGFPKLYVDVTDENDAVTQVYLGEYNVRAFSKIETLEDYIANKFQYLRYTGQQFQTMQAIKAICSLKVHFNLTQTPVSDSEAHGELAENVRECLGYLTDMNVNTLNDLELVSSTAAYVVGDGKFLDSNGRKVAVAQVKSWDAIFQDPKQEAAKFTTPTQVKKFVVNNLSIIGAVAITTSNMLYNKIVMQSDLNHANEIDYDTSVDVGDAKVKVPAQTDEVVKKAVLDESAEQAKKELIDIDEMMDVYSQLIMNNLVADEDAVEFFTWSGLIMQLERSRARKLGKKMVNLGDAGFEFPDICSSIRYNTSCKGKDEYGYGSILWNCIFPAIGRNFLKLAKNTKTIDLDLYNGRLKDFSQIKVENTLEDISIIIPRDLSRVNASGKTLVQPQLKWFEKMNYHKFNVATVRSSVSLELTLTEVEPAFFLFLRHDKKPLLNNYDLLWDTSNLTTTDNGTYSIFVSNTDIKNKRGDFYLGVVQQIGNKNTQLIEFNGTVDHTLVNTSFATEYAVRILTGGCFHFLNSKNDPAWNPTGCKATSISASKTVCRCNHLSRFSTSFVAAPNFIDFEYVLTHASFNDNTTIYATIIVTLSLFVIFLIWARYKDRKDVEKLGALPLLDNKPEDKYLYEILVFTGNVKESGTDSKISFIVSGERAESDVRTFGCPPRRAFDRGSIDVFVMAERRPLGQLQYLRIWHDNSGEKEMASWYLNYVIFRDVQTGEKFEFIAESWFAVELGDRQLDRLIPVADKKRLKEFAHLFSTTSYKTFSDGYLWLSVFFREPRNRFTRCQRVATCVALLYLAMIANAMWYETTPDTPATGFNLGPFALNPEQFAVGFIIQLVIFPPVFLISFLFRRSRPFTLRKSRIDEAIKKQNAISQNGYAGNSQSSKPLLPIKYKRTKNFSLPWWFRIIAWLLCIGIIAASIFFLWAYAIQFGETKTGKWLTSFVISFFCSLLITQPITVFFAALFFSSICKKVETDHDDVDEDEEDPHLKFDEQWLHEAVNPMKPRKAFLKHPDHDEAFERGKKLRQKEVQTRDVLWELFIYIVFIWILAGISYGTHDHNSYWMMRTLKNRFVDRKMLDGKTFLTIKTSDEYWQWLGDILVLQLRVGRRYDNTPPFGMKGFLADEVNRIMGNAILRQVRLKPGLCSAPEVIQNFSRCSGEFTRFVNEDDVDYDMGWKPLNKPLNKTTECMWAFNYRSAEELNGHPFVGNIDNYGGGGYVYELKNKTENLPLDFAALKKNHWIDELTRAVFVEFSVYNAQVNLFGIVALVAEFYPGGGILTDYDIAGIQLLAYEDNTGLFVLVLDIIFILFIIHFTLKEGRVIFKRGRQYFRSYGNINEVFLLLFAYTAMIVYIYRLFAVAESIRKFNKTKGSEYINLQRSKFLTDLFTACVALCIFLSILKFIKLLRFNQRIATLSRSLRQCANDLGGFALVFIIFFLAYALLFHVVYSQNLTGYATFYNSLKSLLSLCLNRFTFNDYLQAHPIIGPVIFFTFTFIMTIILINLLLTVIIVTFERVKHEMAGQTNQYDVVEFIVNGIKNIFGRGSKPAEQPEIKTERNRQDPDANFSDKMDRVLGYINKVYFDNRLDWQKTNVLQSRGKNYYFTSSAKRAPNVYDKPQRVYSSN